MDRWSARLVTTGEIPEELGEALADFSPGDSAITKVRQMLAYRVVHHRLEFDVANAVSHRLIGLDKRVFIAAMMTMVLAGHSQSQTARKYFERATQLYLAGYEAETVIMCAAVLEAALAERFPDELLLAESGEPPRFGDAGYAISQRLRFERKHRPIFSEDERTLGKQLNHWRNDAIHVEPDLGPPASRALTSLVMLLPRIFPSEL